MAGLLEGETAVVTGGASERGIGLAVARLFAEQGARVAVLDVDGDGAERTGDALGVGHRGYRCDVRSRDEVERCVSRVRDELGPVSVLVNNAGVARPTRVGEISDKEYDLVLDVSLRGAFLCSQAVLPQMRERGGGRMVNVSSVAAQRGGGLFGGPHYAAAKAGVLGLTRALARDLAPENVRVNAVAPGFVKTGIFAGELTDALRDEIVGGIPLGRPGAPLDVARCCLFLASGMSGYVTGEVLNVNGGLHIG